MSAQAAVDDPVHLRFLQVRGLPLLVAAVGPHGRGPRLLAALDERGLPAIAGFLGVDLPRGARIGFSVDADDLRLVDEQDATLLRAPRAAVDAGWLAAARRVRGTMLVVVRDTVLSADEDPVALAARIDTLARAGAVSGAIVGVVEERPTLPLLF
ncbi:hypothetical protein [Egicoccus halophilus]|uniref:Uncharacterized protein n=1 Tax=Egicoccus halophilus TaxID=1670830 RepID=A0A8J3AHK0_9ACTN|nr:hypothetical protein [Egicoccus halophilus]GGI09567.1 hypothetical protein GCM10011354_34720 [Egicoccus halophilus]